MKTLIGLVHGLPPELFNDIRDLVFTPDEKRVFINEHYTPPSLLQVSSYTRRQYAERYYGGATEFVPSSAKILAKFLKCLPEAHRGLIQHVCLLVRLHTGEIGPKDLQYLPPATPAHYLERWLQMRQRLCLQYFGASLNDDGAGDLVRSRAVRFAFDRALDGDFENCLRACVGLKKGWKRMITDYKKEIDSRCESILDGLIIPFGF